jgi:ABC-type transporter Mla maintaining outer membrane lipid asymmetry ATPase subunit MlaF
LSINDGARTYGNIFVWNNINLAAHFSEQIAIMGKYDCGKTILIRGILNDPKIAKAARWNTSPPKDIGRLD